MKLDIRILAWFAVCVLCFVAGLWGGYVLHQEHMFKGLVMIAEGLEGSNVEVNIDLNETLIIDKTMDKMKEFGVFDFINESEEVME